MAQTPRAHAFSKCNRARVCYRGAEMKPGAYSGGPTTNAETRALKSLFQVFTALIFAVSFFHPDPARAQQAVWLQVEAQPTLADAQASVRAYAGAFQNVNGFRMRSGWYAIALGPFTRAAAESEMASLKASRLIPADAFIAFTNQYRQQFWPVGASTLNAAPVEPQQPVQAAQPAQPAQPAAPVYVPDETRREARISERSLDADGRKLLQEALQWEGFYTSTIDGAFGPGTRRAMAAWQEFKGYDTTGVLTTRQRAELVETYQSVFAALGLRSVRDTEAGIEVVMPTKLVNFARAEAPFVHYDGTGDSEVRALLISQSGDKNTLFGLYDIMQTLDIVPPEGPRERRDTSFTLSGQDGAKQSYTYARLDGGAVKGFTLVWAPKDERVMKKVTEIMRESFAPIEGAVLPDTAGGDAEQRIDLLAGLEIRRPERSRSGFYVTEEGAVLTTTEVLGQCNRLTIGEEEVVAEVTARDDALGIALLKPSTSLTPISIARFQGSVPRLKSEVAVAGFSYEDVLDLPVLTYGTLADIRGLQGEDTVQRLALAALPGDAGGPVFDRSGAVLGMLHPRPNGDARQLPEDVNFALNVPTIAGFLSAAGISPGAADPAAPIPPEDLTTLAADMTVLVSCWN